MNPDEMNDSTGTAPAVPPDANSGTLAPKVWVVRTDGGKYVERFVSGDYAAVGWFDLSPVDTRDQTQKIYERKYSDAPTDA